MNLYLTSLLIYAIPANLIAGLVYLLGRKDKLKWHWIEFLLIYFVWCMAMGLIYFVFDGLDNAVRQLGVTQNFLTGMMVGAGVLGGLSLLPRLFFEKQQQYAILITSISSFIFAVFFAKFGLLFFLLAG